MYIDEKVQCFREDHGDNFFGQTDSRIVDFLHLDYNNDFEGRNGKLELELRVDLKIPEWLSQKEKVNQTLKEIWKTGEMKNNYGLDLNWPVASKPKNKNDNPTSQIKITLLLIIKALVKSKN